MAFVAVDAVLCSSDVVAASCRPAYSTEVDIARAHLPTMVNIYTYRPASDLTIDLSYSMTNGRDSFTVSPRLDYLYSVLLLLLRMK